MQTKTKKTLSILLIVVFITTLFIYSKNDNSYLPSDTNPTSESENINTTNGNDTSDESGGIDKTKSASPNGSIVNIAPKQDEISKSIEKEIEYRLLEANDPLPTDKWYLNNIRTNEAWNQMSSYESSVVAVIDSGFAIDHEDLRNKWYVNEGENGDTVDGDTCWDGTSKPKKSNNCDDDNNGYVDDHLGWDFYYIDNIPDAGSENSNGSGVEHGTEVAGLVGADTNNSLGISSIGFTNKIMPLQVMNDDGVGYTSDIVSAIYYAVDNGASVINLSLGSAYPDNAMKTAIDYAQSNNVLVIAAAGNCGDNIVDGFCELIDGSSVTYPAKYQNVVAVGSVNQSNERSSFSSYGPEIDVVAPGEGSISSTSWSSSNQNSLYANNLYGTSFASPIVASLAGIIKSHNNNLNVEGLRSILIANSKKLNNMNSNIFDDYYGHGLVDAYEAIILSKSIIQTDKYPKLLHTGNSNSESTYSMSTTMNASCETENGQMCSIVFKQTSGKLKYTPYKTVNNLSASWSWNSSALKSEPWEIKAISGNNYSAGKYIFNK